MLKNEDWLSRGVKNVVGIPRPTAYEIDLQNDPAFVERAASWGLTPVDASTLYVKVAYALLFTIVLVIILWGAQMALNSPWGRMMRAIRDNETAAEAMGKDVTRRHLQIFVIGSAVVGLAGAMMTTLVIILPVGKSFYFAMFVIAWIGQFYGHKVEGKKPSFFKDLQFLLVGPAWCMDAFLGKALPKWRFRNPALS